MALSGTIDPSVYRALTDVLRRSPEVASVRYEPDAVVKRSIRARVGPNRVDPPTGPESPTLDVEWRFADDESQYRIHYVDGNTGFNCGWHRDDDHPELGAVHFQYHDPATGANERVRADFEKNAPTEVLWSALDRLFDERLPELTGSP
jgi:hypothetical protein